MTSARLLVTAADVPVDTRGASLDRSAEVPVVFLPESGSLLVGRSFHAEEQGPQLRLRSPYVARRHATFYREGVTWYVRDEKSPGGFMVDAVYVTHGRGPHRLNDGARIRFGEVRLTFRS